MSDTVDENFEFQKVIAIVGVTLLIIKYMAYFMTGSVAIFTDATESIVNVVAAFVGLYALYISSQPADKDHPFGHGKIETISATIEGSLIIAAGAVIVYESIESLFNPGEIGQLDYGLLLVGFAAFVNYAVGRIAIRKGNKARSPALVASGKHLCSDTYSSIGIIIGLAIVFVAQSQGYDARWLDSSIAMLFGAIIIVTGLGVLKHSVQDIMDKADQFVTEDVVNCIRTYRHDDWIDVYNVRIIKYGPRLYVDMHVVFPSNMTVIQISDEYGELLSALKEKFGDDLELTVNPVPCKNSDCVFCSRECNNRSRLFVKKIDWNCNTLSCCKRHVIQDVLTIDDGSSNR